MGYGRITRSILKALDKIADLLGKRPDRAAHLETGARGEEDAYFWLRRQGYTMVARNYRSPHRKSELDLVGWNDGMLCFIEVKTRSSREFMPAEAAVDQDKQRDLISIAHDYMRHMPEAPAQYRFDVVSVYYDKDEPDISLIKDAFSEAGAFARR